MAGRQRPRFVGVWLSEAGLAAVDKLAAETRVSRSEMVRTLLAEAVTARTAPAVRPAWKLVPRKKGKP